MVESQFAHVVIKKPRKSRKLRKNYKVTVLASRKAKGQYRKGEGFNKSLHVDRTPVMGDAITTTERAIWLRGA